MRGNTNLRMGILNIHNAAGLARAGLAGRRGADYALVVPVNTRNSSLVPSGATSTSSSSPRENSPSRIFSDSGSSMYRWIARFKRTRAVALVVPVLHQEVRRRHRSA